MRSELSTTRWREFLFVRRFSAVLEKNFFSEKNFLFSGKTSKKKKFSLADCLVFYTFKTLFFLNLNFNKLNVALAVNCHRVL